MTDLIGPPTAAADELHAMKYRGPGEDFEEYGNRVAFGLADDSRHYRALRPILLHQRFLPGGRVQGSIGATRMTTAFNCYVSGTIDDSLGNELSTGSIMDRLKEAAITSKLGGGIGYDFSPLRPRGYRVKKIESDATGPGSFMEYFNVIGLIIQSSGHRRGAQMGILRVDHPDVEEFIRLKQWTPEQNAIWAATSGLPATERDVIFRSLQAFNKLVGFNVSVAITDEFMEAVYADGLFELRFEGSVDREVRAVDLWQKIMRSTWDYAEPGVFFVDTVNRMNNLRYCETIAACNPCGEQPLPPYGACLLGSYNLTRYLRRIPVPDGKVIAREAFNVMSSDEKMNLLKDGGTIVDDPKAVIAFDFDFDFLIADVPIVVRGMDNVNDRSLYPLEAQRQEAINKRRMGLGVTGLANAGEALGYQYGSTNFLAFESRVLATIRDECYRASIELSKEKGSFPLFDQRYLKSEFVKTLPDDVRDGITRHGIRNSHLTSIAPTGTISMCAGNVSGGIEPVFAHATERKIQTPNGPVIARLGDYGADFLGVRGKTITDVTPVEHVAVLVTAQKFVDSAVTKTCNVTGDTPWDEFVGIYETAYRGGAKGCTTFNRDGRRASLLKTSGVPAESDDGPSCAIDANGVRSCE